MDNARLDQIERQLVEELMTRLGPEAREIAESQLREVNRVRRLSEGREVMLRKTRLGFSRPFHEQFPMPEPEIRVATIWIDRRPSSNHREGETLASIWLAGGRIFSLEFARRPQWVDDGDFEIRDVVVHFDPMSSESWSRVSASVLSDWLPESMGPVEDVRAPLGETLRDRLVESMDFRVPEDWREMLSRCDGFRMGDVVTHGLMTMRRVDTPDYQLLLLAEDEHGNYLVVIDGEDGELGLVEEAGDVAQPLDTSFRQGFAQLKLAAAQTRSER